MKSDYRPPDPFEDRLLHELKQFVATQPAPRIAAASSTRTNRLSRPGYRMALAGTTVAAIAGAAVVVGHDPTTPAYAFESQPNGSVTVEINSLRDAAGLESKFRAQGISAVVRYLPAGKACRQQHPELEGADGPAGGEFSTHVERAGAGKKTHSQSGEKTLSQSGRPGGEHPSLGALVLQRAGDSAKFTIPADSVPAGNTLVIEGSKGTGTNSLSIAVQSAPVAPCELIDAPLPPKI